MLSDLARKVLTGDRELKERLAKELKVDYQTVGVYILKNKPFNPLTSMPIVNLIAEETGLTQEQIIQEKEAA